MRGFRGTEASIENVLEAVKAYAAISGYIGDFAELEQQISKAWANATSRQFSFDDHSVILGKTQRDRLTRWGAWISQRLFNTRATCVGNHILQLRESGWRSPLVEQLRQYGLEPRAVRFEEAHRIGSSGPSRPHKCVDGLLIRPSNNEIVAVRAAPLERQRSNELPTLFNPIPRSLPRAEVASRAISTLIQAKFVLQSAIPSAHVRCILILVDPDIHSREFVAYETTESYFKQITGPRFDLSSLPLLASTQDMLHNGEDVESVSLPPDLIVREPLMRLPVDRATRAMMALDVLWQRQAAQPGLVAMTVAALAAEIQSRFMIEYTVDHQRHDLEDCLVNGGFIERPEYEGKCFSLTSTGVFQALVGRRMLQIVRTPKEELASEPFILAPIRRQARLWARYHNGEQVLDLQ